MIASPQMTSSSAEEFSFGLRQKLPPAPLWVQSGQLRYWSAMVNLWPIKSPDEIRSKQIKSNRDSNMAGDCHNLLTLLKRVRGSGEIFQLYGKNQNESEGSTDLPFLASQKLILTSQQGYFPDSNRFDSICFYTFKGQLYPYSPYK